MGGKTTQKNIEEKKTQHKSDNGFCFFSFFFFLFLANGKKMRRPRHGGFLSLRITRCLQATRGSSDTGLLCQTLRGPCPS